MHISLEQENRTDTKNSSLISKTGKEALADDLLHRLSSRRQSMEQARRQASRIRGNLVRKSISGDISKISTSVIMSGSLDYIQSGKDVSTTSNESSINNCQPNDVSKHEFVHINALPPPVKDISSTVHDHLFSHSSSFAPTAQAVPVPPPHSRRGLSKRASIASIKPENNSVLKIATPSSFLPLNSVKTSASSRTSISTTNNPHTYSSHNQDSFNLNPSFNQSNSSILFDNSNFDEFLSHGKYQDSQTKFSSVSSNYKSSSNDTLNNTESDNESAATITINLKQGNGKQNSLNDSSLHHVHESVTSEGPSKIKDRKTSLIPSSSLSSTHQMATVGTWGPSSNPFAVLSNLLPKKIGGNGSDTGRKQKNGGGSRGGSGMFRSNSLSGSTPSSASNTWGYMNNGKGGRASIDEVFQSLMKKSNEAPEFLNMSVSKRGNMFKLN